MSAPTHLYSGKVRDLYAVGDGLLLVVASDRLSAFDVVMREPIPNKGRVLTAMSDFFCDELDGIVTPARVTCKPSKLALLVEGIDDLGDIAGRAMLQRRADMVPLECIVRGRLAGHAFEEYKERGTINSAPAPRGLDLGAELPEPIFTPSTKEEEGHDRYLSADEAAELVGPRLFKRLADAALALYEAAAKRVAACGLVLADTKFEFGLIEGELVLCDEVVTPDSSRLWERDAIVIGTAPPAFDKQPFRDWLSTLPWDRTPPPPAVPDDVVAETSRRYVDAYERVTGRAMADWYGAAT